MSGLLAGKTAIIYGGGGALGGAAARVFAREGARVFLAGRTRSKLEAVAGDIESAGGTAEIATLDLFDEAQVRNHADAVAAKTGGIDVMFNAIGIKHVQGKAFAETSLEEFEQPIARTVRAEFIAAQAVAVIKSQRGRVMGVHRER